MNNDTTFQVRTSARNSLIRTVVAVLGIALIFAIAGPVLLSGYATKIANLAAVYAVVAAGAAVLYGRLGFVSLNQVALVGVGGWVFLRVGHAASLPSPLLLVIAGLVTCLVGTVIGLPSLRLSGLTLALVSLMAAGAFEILFYGIGFPNGGGGWTGRTSGSELSSTVPRPDFATSDDAMFRYTVLVAAVLLVGLWLTQRSRVGRAWAAIRQSEAGAYATGVDVTRYRLVALVLTSFTAGVAGGLLGAGTGRLDPISFPAQQSIVLFAVVLIGGAFSVLLGGVLAGALYILLPALLNEAGLDANLVLVVFGVGLVQAIVTAPRGMAGQLEDLVGRLRRGRSRAGRPQDRDARADTTTPTRTQSSPADLAEGEKAAHHA